MTEPELRREVHALRMRNHRLRAMLRLVLLVLRISGISFKKRRLREGASKARLLRTIENARRVLPLRAILRALQLSPSRYHSWRRSEEACNLDDRRSCPRTSPHRLTTQEVATIQEMATSKDYRHVPTGILAVLAQRIGRVFASPTTWRRLVRIRKWRRPRKRVHPSKPKVGIRASTPNQYWHVDTTVIRLLDGTRTYLQAVIDNFSRRILAWRVADRLVPGSTVSLLLDASGGVVSGDDPPTVLVDGGVENFNDGVDKLIGSGRLRRLLAMTEILFSNSLIESWWRVLKHQWLYLNSLDTISTVRGLVAFYVHEHNTRLPHSAFRGQTPDEMYFATGEAIPNRLTADRAAARSARLEANRALSCDACERRFADD